MRVCAQTTFIAELWNFLYIYKGCDHLLTPIRKGRRISKGDTRNTVEYTGQYSGVLTERRTFLPQFRPFGFFGARPLLFLVPRQREKRRLLLGL